jgi:hypothetical protein
MLPKYATEMSILWIKVCVQHTVIVTVKVTVTGTGIGTGTGYIQPIYKAFSWPTNL